MIQLMREERRALYCITSSQQIPNQHATTTKQNREKIFFCCKSEDLCCSHICRARWVKTASFKSSVFTLNLQYLGKLPPSTRIQGHTISFPSVSHGACCLQRALPLCPGMLLKVRFPGIRGSSSQKQRYWTFYFLFAATALPVFSDFSAADCISEKDTGKGSFRCPYPSVSWYHSELTWLPVPCKAVSWLLWSILMRYQPEHNISQPWPLHPPLGAVALQAQQSFIRQGISPGAFSTSCSFLREVKELGWGAPKN